jgi:dinuclear metal center YbgI/SA1388 family protein
MKIFELIQAFETIAPLSLQEDYDNSGLLVGNLQDEVTKVLLAFEITDAVLDEALQHHCDAIISHHPIVFKGLKKINGKNLPERAVIRAIQNGIALIALHTNMDNVLDGTNSILAQKLGLKNLQVMQPLNQSLQKLVVFVPQSHSELVQKAAFEAGAGHIGNYDQCGFTTSGTGSFRALEGAEPFVGSLNHIHLEPEIRFETLFPSFLSQSVISAIKKVHPYEEPAFDLIALQNKNEKWGAGILGELEHEMNELDFLHLLKSFNAGSNLRYSPLTGQKIKRVALCGGSGAFLIQKALQLKAHVFITGDVKYHDFFEPDGKMLIADIGHYESEHFILQLFIALLKEKFPTFAVRNSEVNTNPVNYL